jgi:uncharacterized protein (DUF2141 family)
MYAAALALLLSAAPPPQAATPAPAPTPEPLPVTLAYAVDGVKNAKGQLVIAVYASQATWLDLARAVRVLKVAAAPGTVFAVMEGLPAGPCAVAVFHDENGNGKLDMGWFPLPGPTEGTAASNGAKGTMGPPRFEEARIECRPGETVVRMKLSY